MKKTAQPALANPVLIGAVTVLVAIVAVFLAYNATNGLPFVPTRELKVDFANGAALTSGNLVEQGGYQVGVVSEVHPVDLANGTVGAEATLALNEANGNVPVDSTATIRPLSVLGLKYVNLSYGHSNRIYPNGGTLPVSHTTVGVQFDDINTMFDAKTRPAVEQNLAGYGNALTARGSALNDTIASLPALLGHLRPVAAYLSDPHTQLTRFLGALNGFFSTISPVAQVNSRLFTDQATTLAAVSNSPPDLENTIKLSPPTLDVSTASLKAQQPFLTDLTTFANAMAPATAELRAALPNVNPALAAGARVLPRTPSMDQRLANLLNSLQGLAHDPGTNLAVNGLGSTVSILDPMIRYLGPYITVCNAFNYSWVQLGDLVSEQTNVGMAQRALVNFANQQTDSEGTAGAAQPSNGQNVPPGQVPEYLHGPAYGAAIDNQGNADCEPGQRGYVKRLDYVEGNRRNIDAEQHSPGDQGTTWTGLSRVPPGETFTRNPSTGPLTSQLAPTNPANP